MFIAFEGLDGSGSSTHSAAIAQRLREDEYDVVLTKEPTDNVIGGIIRGVLSHKLTMTPETLQLLFSADRGHHLMEIEPWLKEGKIVMTDRYMMSTFAFGSLSIDDPEWLKALNSKFKEPDLTILIKVDPEECIRRINASRGRTELFEDVDKLKKIWKRYEELSKELHNVIIIDGNPGIKEVQENIYEVIKKRLKK